MPRAVILALAAACSSKAAEPPKSSGSAATGITGPSAPAGSAEPAAVQGDAPAPATVEAPLPEGASKRLGGTRFHHAGLMYVVAVSPDGKVVASGAGDNTIRVWNATTGAVLYAPELKTFMDRVETILFVGDEMIYGSGSNPIVVVSTKDWTEQRQLETCGKHWTRGIAASPDGKTLAITCEYDNEVRLQPTAGGTHVAIKGIKKPDDIAWSADGNWIAVETMDEKYNHAIELIDVQASKVVRKAPVGNSGAHAMAFAPQGAVLAYDDHDKFTEEKVVLYDAAANKTVGAFPVHVGIDSIAFSKDGKALAFAQLTGTRTIVAIDLATSKRRELLRPTRTISAMAFGATSSQLWIAHDRGLRLYDLATDREAFGPAGHIGEITALAYRPDGKALASGSSDGTIRLWDVAAGTSRKLEVLTDEYGIIFIESESDYQKFSLGPLTTLRWSKNGDLLYETDGFIGTGMWRMWEPSRGAQLRAIGVQRIGTRGMVMTPDEKTAIVLGSVDGDKTLRWLDLGSGKKTRELPDMGDAALVMSPDGTRVAVGGDGAIEIFDTATGKKLSTFEETIVYALAWSPDGKRIALGNSYQATLLDAATGKRLVEHSIDGGAYAVAVTADGRLVAGGYKGDVLIGKADPKAEPFSSRGHRGKVQALAVSPDGKSVASGAADGQILIWPL